MWAIYKGRLQNSGTYSPFPHVHFHTVPSCGGSWSHFNIVAMTSDTIHYLLSVQLFPASLLASTEKIKIEARRKKTQIIQ